MKARVLLFDGLFLSIVGGVQLVFEVAGHFAGAGPLGRVFADSPYTLGWFEAHGLALLIGILLLAVGRRDGRRFWHGFAAAVHLLLGGANLLFWDSFITFDVVPMGIVATAIHAVFVVANGACLAADRRAAAVG
jgi:hypothetical protein